MQATLSDWFNQLVIWLNQDSKLYWLVGTFLAVAVLLWLIRQNFKRLQHRLETELEQKFEIEKNNALSQQQVLSLQERKANLDALVNDLNYKHEQQLQQINKLSINSAELKNSRDEKNEQLSSLKNERHSLREKVDRANQQIAQLQSELTAQQAHLDAETNKVKSLIEQFDQQKADLKNEFRVLSEAVIKERQQQLQNENNTNVGAILKPLQEQILGFQKRVNEVHDASIQGNAELKTEIENVKQMGIKISDEATNLTQALKGDSQQRGAWGEAQLERTLELSGLIEHDHYQKQTSFTDSDGKQKRTDYIVKLPGKKCIIIDSKVSLIDYERSVNDEINSTLAMQAHIKAVRKHINDLASKDYSDIYEMHSPDFVLMFMPIEPAYIEALKHDKELFAYGYNKNIILVSHTTLIPILRTVANLWMMDKSTKEVRQISAEAGKIYNSVVLVSERLQSLGKTLNTASNHYNQTVTALAGVQGLQGKVQRFTELSNKTRKSMPAIEPIHLEHETEKLTAEPLNEIEDQSDD